MRQIKPYDIDGETMVCPYCMKDFDIESGRSCCGEIHSEKAYVTFDGDCYLDSEVEVVELTESELEEARQDDKFKNFQENGN